MTRPERTIADLRWSVARSGGGGLVTPSGLRRAIRQAEVLGLPTGIEVHDGTRSELERRFLALCSRHRIPPPEVNVRLGPILVDFLWREASLVVETDGYRYHRGRAAFEDDRARDLELRRRGLTVIRLTHRQVAGEPERVAAVLREAVVPAP